MARLIFQAAAPAAHPFRREKTAAVFRKASDGTPQEFADKNGQRPST